MPIKSITPELVVQDMQATISFYGKLGFVIAQKVPEEGTPVWVEMRCGDISLMAQKREEVLQEMPALAHRPTGGIAILLMRLQSKEEMQTLMASFPAALTMMNLRETDYGTAECALTDPDGYVILLSTPV